MAFSAFEWSSSSSQLSACANFVELRNAHRTRSHKACGFFHRLATCWNSICKCYQSHGCKKKSKEKLILFPGPSVQQDQSILFGPPHRQNLHHLGALKEKPAALAEGLKKLFSASYLSNVPEFYGNRRDQDFPFSQVSLCDLQQQQQQPPPG